uniref:Uncharacterized protein n=1 Tax=Arundo donax TaxID=35708 RepID=A0A0A9B329_ARUDO
MRLDSNSRGLVRRSPTLLPCYNAAGMKSTSSASYSPPTDAALA